MDHQSTKEPNSAAEIAFAVCVGICFFLANFLFVVVADRLTLYDEYLKGSALIIGPSAMLIIYKSRLGGAGAITLGFISLMVVLLNLMFVGYGDM